MGLRDGRYSEGGKNDGLDGAEGTGVRGRGAMIPSISRRFERDLGSMSNKDLKSDERLGPLSDASKFVDTGAFFVPSWLPRINLVTYLGGHRIELRTS